MANSVSADDEGQQSSNSELIEGDQLNNILAPSSLEAENNGFDADAFAAMMQQELIAYKISWDPLMKMLQVLGKSMARHQEKQRDNDSSIKKIQDQVVQQEHQVAALRDDVTRADDEKKQAAAAIEAMQNQVGELQSRLEESKELAPVEAKDEQRQDGVSSQEQGPTKGTTREEDASIAVEKSLRTALEKKIIRENSGHESILSLGEAHLLHEKMSSQENDSSRKNSTYNANSIDGQPFVTVMDLAEAERKLREELQKALAQALGHHSIDESDEKNDGDRVHTEHIAQIDDNSRVIEPLSPRAHEVEPSVISATDFKELEHKVKILQGLQDALAAKVSEHDLIFDKLDGRIVKLDDRSSQVSALLVNPRSIEGLDDAVSRSDVSSLLKNMIEPNNDYHLNMASLSNEFKELKAVQDDHDLNLRKHDTAVKSHTAEIKALTHSLDHLSVQQQAVALMFTTGPRNDESNGRTTIAEVSADDSASSMNTRKQANAAVESTSQPQLDLSLAFTKLVDFRRSTDASLQLLQHTMKEVAGTTQAQQEQLNALRNSVVFSKQSQVYLVEARLAMQKELLARNEAFQDHTNSQLIEWRKLLLLTEDKLLGGISDAETRYTLQQMQRGYYRTLHTVNSLVSSPLIISGALHTLSNKIKQLQSAERSDAVPFQHREYSNLREQAKGEANKSDCGENDTRKLHCLDEEIDAALQVNIAIEKKNDPLLKGLDALRETLELLWSIWHRNDSIYSVQPNEIITVREHAPTDTAGDGQHVIEEHHQSIQQRNPDGQQELEMRVSGAVRRLAMVEKDIERLNSQVIACNALKLPGDGNIAVTNERSSDTNNLRTELVMEEMEKLRRDMHAEIDSLHGKLQRLSAKESSSINTSCESTTSLVLPNCPNMVEIAANQGNDITNLFSQMTNFDLDCRVNNSKEDQKQFYDNFLQEVTTKVLEMVKSESEAQCGPVIGETASTNVNLSLLLKNFAQKVDNSLENARGTTSEELARFRRELIKQFMVRFEVAIRDIRGKLMLLQPVDGDSTAMGTKNVMCVACSRPAPVSSRVRETGSLPIEMAAKFGPMGSHLAAEFDNDRSDDDFVFRAGFKMPAHDRKIMTLPFLANAVRNKLVVNKPEGKRKRPPRQSHLNRVDNVVREAMELDRASRDRGIDTQ